MTTYAFDGDGNLLTTLAPGNQLTTNTWDGENRLTQVALPSAIVDSFTYNGDGQRVQKQDSTGTTNHIWDGQNIMLETNSSNIIQVVYTLEPLLYGNLISQSRSGVDSFFLFDAPGSTRQLASLAGSVTDSYLYDAFGNIVLTSGATTNCFRFVGELGYYFDADPVSYLLRARPYDASRGRLLSRDPLASPTTSRLLDWLPHPTSGRLRVAIVNVYAYVNSRPTYLTDPSGLEDRPPPNDWFECWAHCIEDRRWGGPVTGVPCVGNAFGNWCWGRYPRSGIGGPAPWRGDWTTRRTDDLATQDHAGIEVQVDRQDRWALLRCVHRLGGLLRPWC